MEEVDEDTLVLKRVTFLMQNPHLIPEYDLLESNCETVAVWCKTGSFRTFQVAGLVDGGKRNSATVAASSVIASSLLGPLAIPAAVGAEISFSALAIKGMSNENKWKERTRILNEEFKRWEEGQGSCRQQRLDIFIQMYLSYLSGTQNVPASIENVSFIPFFRRPPCTGILPSPLPLGRFIASICESNVDLLVIGNLWG